MAASTALLEIDASVSSVQDLKAVVLEIREYAKWFAHNQIKKRVGAKTGHDQPKLSPAASAALHDWSAKQPLSSKRLDELVATLEDYAETAPQLTITLAAPATPGLKKTLVGWCRANIAPHVLVTFQFNQTLLGGMVIRDGSRVFDWSFRRYILENRAHFPEVLRRV